MTIGGALVTRPAGKVSADLTARGEGTGMAIIEAHGKRLGNAADAGALCVTSRSPNGVSGDVYRNYLRDTQSYPDVPGPFMVRGIAGGKVPARDENGAELFDLDAVAEWNSRRPGIGSRRGRPLRWTETRQEILAGAAAGKLSLVEGRPYLDGVEQRTRRVERITEFLEADLIKAPSAGKGRYMITPAGKRWLANPPGPRRRTAPVEPDPEPDPVPALV